MEGETSAGLEFSLFYLQVILGLNGNHVRRASLLGQPCHQALPAEWQQLVQKSSHGQPILEQDIDHHLAGGDRSRSPHSGVVESVSQCHSGNWLGWGTQG